MSFTTIPPITRLIGPWFFLVLLTACGQTVSHDSPEFNWNGGATTLVRSATIFDGSGSPSFQGDIRFAESGIIEIGHLSPQNGETVINAEGLAIAPGFIDTHSHHVSGIFERPEVLGAVSQGVTTIIVGQDGGSHFPLTGFFEHFSESPLPVNIGSFVGHNTLRGIAMGHDSRREATQSEIAAMSELIEQEMAAGALGLSTGLEYDTGIYSTRDEVLALARTTHENGGRYFSHIRSEDRAVWEAIDEIIGIGEQTGIPVHVSHIKLAIKSSWGRADEVVNLLDAARSRGVKITAEVYPYTYWASSMTVLLPDRNFEDREAVRFALEQLAPADTIRLLYFAPNMQLVGSTVDQIAHAANEDSISTYIRLLSEAQIWLTENPDAQFAEYISAVSMNEADIVAFLQWPHTNITTDGMNGGHPRGYGAFTRVLGKYIREDGHLSLEEGIRKMTSLSAANAGLERRGLIKKGYAADLVLFDPGEVIDQATLENSTKTSSGIVGVWTNGQKVFGDGALTGALPGQVLKNKPTNSN